MKKRTSRRGSPRLTRNEPLQLFKVLNVLGGSASYTMGREVAPTRPGRAFETISCILADGRPQWERERIEFDRYEIAEGLLDADGTQSWDKDAFPLFVLLSDEQLDAMPVATVKVVRLAEDWKRSLGRGDYALERAGSLRTTRKGFKIHAPGCRLAVAGTAKHLPARLDPWNRTELAAETERTELWPSLHPPTCAKCAKLPFAIP